MLRFALVLAVATTSTGCTKRQQDFAWFAAAVAIEVANASAEAEAERRTRVAVAAPNPDHYAGPSQEDLQRAHEVAMELTRIAAHDARTDNCDAVARTSNHVRVIDPGVFANVFLRDVAIQRCLALTP